MTLFVVEKQVGTHWKPKTFWIGPIRFGLHTFPDCRVRRVISRYEANELAAMIPVSKEFLRFDWSCADDYNWNWPQIKDES